MHDVTHIRGGTLFLRKNILKSTHSYTFQHDINVSYFNYRTSFEPSYELNT